MSARPHISGFSISDFGCIQQCDLQLTRLHALIGPNDSGKSTLLRALKFAHEHIAGSNDVLFRLVWENGLSLSNRGLGPVWADGPRSFPPGGALPERYVVPTGAVRTYRLNPDDMRRPHALIPHGREVELANERGLGLPAVYDALLNRNRRVVDQIEGEVRKRFPQVESVVLLTSSASEKQIAVQIRGRAEPVTGAALSEGLLYFLAFASLQYLAPSALILIEEPENGLHPARIGEVVSILREVSQQSQVVMATHSPLVINELSGDEVSVVTRDDRGTHAKLLSASPDYAERQRVYKNGELWLGYGDGDQESRLTGTAGQ